MYTIVIFFVLVSDIYFWDTAEKKGEFRGKKKEVDEESGGGEWRAVLAWRAGTARKEKNIILVESKCTI